MRARLHDINRRVTEKFPLDADILSLGVFEQLVSGLGTARVTSCEKSG